jgi:hypothetical protein
VSAVAEEPGYRLAYEEARRALDDQEALVNELRARTGVLIAAAAVSTSLVGGPALARGHSIASWVAIGLFALVGVSLLVALWPRRIWSFSIDAAELVAIYLEPEDDEPLDVAHIYRDLALHMSEGHKRNAARIPFLMAVLRIAVILLVVDVMAWVVALVASP